MLNGYVLRLKKDRWSVSFRPYPFQDRLTVGGGDADVRVPDCPDGAKVTCAFVQNGFTLSAVGCDAGGAREAAFGAHETAAWHVSAGSFTFELTVSPLSRSAMPVYDRAIDLLPGASVHVGAQTDAHLIVRHPLVTGELCSLTREGERLQLSLAPDVPQGVYVNTTRVDRNARLQNGDFIFAPGFRACWLDGQLLIPSEDGVTVRGLHYLDGKERNNHLDYPCVSRTTRHIMQRSDEPIEVLDPPIRREKDKGNLLISLLPIAAMIALTALLRSRFSSDMSMVLFSVASLAIGGVTSVMTYIRTSREFKQQEEQRVSTYRQYIREQEHQIQLAREDELSALNAAYISGPRELQRVDDFSADLFDRRADDPDFLDLRLGVGRRASGRPIRVKKHEVFEPQDDLLSLPERLRQKYAYIDDAPVYISAREANAIGVIGDEDKLCGLLRNLLLDLVTRQYFGDICLYSFLSDAFLSELESVRLLPHFRNPAMDMRSIAHNDETKTALLEQLYKALSDREGVGELPAEAPWYVVFAYAGDPDVMRHPAMRYVHQASRLHALFIFLTVHRELLPQGCAYTVQLMTNRMSGLIRSMAVDAPDQLFEYTPVARQDMRRISLRLCPVYGANVSLSARLPSSASLFGMLGITAPNGDAILADWRAAVPEKSLAAPLGITETGDVLALDLHERAHGPHGLVAGTTGSGKTQVLISYMLALASRFSPEDVAFAVIDFKGGDIIKQLPGLPHIVGAITNLEKREITRSLKAINAEKNRRMLLFAQPSVNASNIAEYTKAYREGRTDVPLPHLIIIVDEFAELKSQHPDFMQDLISVARVGRSLGIHLILCTQKPAGVVDGQIWSNSDFKLCLRVQNKDDSNEVLKSPLAAEIREPGRGYLQVGRTEQFVLFQSGYSGVPESAERARDAAFDVYQLNLSGQKTRIYAYRPEKVQSDVSQREAMLAAIHDAWDASGLRAPAQLCLPALPEVLPFKLMAAPAWQVPLGLIDDPDRQAVRPLILDLSAGNAALIGGSQMGKTQALMTVLRQLASAMTPDDVQVYMLDYNSLILKTFEPLSIVGGVATADEEEKLKSLLKLLREEIGRRKNLFMQAGITSFTAYREKDATLPLIWNVLDNYSAFRELYEDRYGEELDFVLREGPAVGVTFAVTAQQVSLLTYRKMIYFSQRFALPMSDASEYSSVFEGCHMDLPAVPGRVIVNLDKEFYEGQVYEAFPGETESQKADAIRDFVRAHSGRPRARALPSVPSVLTGDYLRDTFPAPENALAYAYGMEYETVSPATLALDDCFSLALIGADQEARDRWLDGFLRHVSALAGDGNARLYILDDYQRKLKAYQALPGVQLYSADASDADQVLTDVSGVLEERLERARASDDGRAEGELIVIVLNSQETIRRISDSSLMMDQFNTMADQYRHMKVMFLFTSVANRAISYSSPELLRFVRDEREGLIFDDLGSVKAYDISLADQRENARPRSRQEAFRLSGDDIARVRLLDRA